MLLEQDVSLDEIRDALRRLAAHGAKPYWLNEVGQPLLRLRQVRHRAAEMGSDVAPEKAAVEVLRDAAKELPRSQRTIVMIVLGLDEQYLGMTAKDRRQLAGERFREGTRPVSWGTIRQYHEPKAMDRLASTLLESEHRFSPWPETLNAADAPTAADDTIRRVADLTAIALSAAEAILDAGTKIRGSLERLNDAGELSDAKLERALSQIAAIENTSLARIAEQVSGSGRKVTPNRLARPDATGIRARTE